MPRRVLPGSEGLVYHVLNRSVRRVRLFSSAADYDAFLRVLREALAKTPTRLLAFCIMPNHWHLVIWPIANELPNFMHLLTMTHAKRWHRHHRTTGTGPVYQNRYHSVPVQTETHFVTVVRYVERNPVRAGLTVRAEDWAWSSVGVGCRNCDSVHLAEWPIPRPPDWLEHVNVNMSRGELDSVRDAVRRHRPIGDEGWVTAIAARYNLSLRGPGRPHGPEWRQQ